MGDQGGWWRGQWNSWILKSWKWEVRRKKNPPSYSFREEEALLWATEKAQDKHVGYVLWLVNLRMPRDSRNEFMNEKLPKQQSRGHFLTVPLRTWTKNFCLVQLVWTWLYFPLATFAKTDASHEINLAEWLVFIHFSVGHFLRRSLVVE